MPYVELVAPRCPERIELETLAVMVPGERVACFGDQAIEFEGTLRPPPSVGPEIYGDFKPRWLADPNIVNVVTGELDAGIGLNLRIPPSVTERPEVGYIHVRGHFDDPAAANCAVALDTPWRNMNPSPAPGAFARLWCRQMFVVEAWKRVY